MAGIPAPGQWKSSLFSCCDDVGLCFITLIVPCVTFGKNAEAAGVTSCMLGALAMFIPLVNIFCLVKVRGAIREQNGIEGGVVGDFFMIICCGLCAMTQEAREVAGGPGGVVPRV